MRKSILYGVIGIIAVALTMVCIPIVQHRRAMFVFNELRNGRKVDVRSVEVKQWGITTTITDRRIIDDFCNIIASGMDVRGIEEGVCAQSQVSLSANLGRMCVINMYAYPNGEILFTSPPDVLGDSVFYKMGSTPVLTSATRTLIMTESFRGPTP